jgi:hypothetical protein
VLAPLGDAGNFDDVIGTVTYQRRVSIFKFRQSITHLFSSGEAVEDTASPENGKGFLGRLPLLTSEK